ncbi:MAG: Inositol 2-dehydrogenase/D-chiro-inositol 3-dehydrogenase [Candidatus Scalindua arabica]|uniref:Inositol 2-dehydrogenase/D-chiro-inositol 3-dehydrogenase n=1 Tax=Candidatus Scalindua arabica TaxID=1127984 RepID=A0A941W365_9BACT|nr:Inositol 2-dehydrogenase/D-chiro-inositol 3-dehydrogenase [Candidatus Scalindua arabica]
MTNIAVVGSGYWGKNLVRNFNELGTLHTVCETNPETLLQFQEKYPEVEFQSSLHLVLQNPSIDAVVIATPAETHFEMARMALLANKHVFVEKPLALFASEAEELNKLAIRQNLILMVGHILLYHPAIIKLKEIINSGELGKINYIYSNRLNLGKIRNEENILWSFAPHDISAIVYLLDEMPSQVIAQGGNYLNHNIADVTNTSLSFKSGVRGHIFVSWLHPNKEQKLIIMGDNKMAVFDDTATEGKLQIHDKGVDWINRQPVPRRNGSSIVPIDSCEPLKAECQHFLECIKTGSTPRTDGVNGINVLKILNACQDSLEHNSTVVRLNGNDHTETFFAHETAVVDSPCNIGNGTKIWHFSHIMPKADIGNNCNIGQNVSIASDVAIGNNVKIQNNVSVYSGVILEDDVFCGPSMVFTNVINPRSHISRKNEYRLTRVKKGATIGANATIVCGNTIGSHSFIGAGAVVTKDVPDHALVLGNPARIAGWVCECGNQLDFQDDIAACDSCSKQYKKVEGGIKCLECNCGKNLDQYNDSNTHSDCKKQTSDKLKESIKPLEKELTLTQEAFFCPTS